MTNAHDLAFPHQGAQVDFNETIYPFSGLTAIEIADALIAELNKTQQ